MTSLDWNSYRRDGSEAGRNLSLIIKHPPTLHSSNTTGNQTRGIYNTIFPYGTGYGYGIMNYVNGYGTGRKYGFYNFITFY